MPFKQQNIYLKLRKKLRQKSFFLCPQLENKHHWTHILVIFIIGASLIIVNLKVHIIEY